MAMPARPCPVCGKGMFRPKALWRHIVECHPELARAWGYQRQSGEEIRRRTKRRRERKAKRRGK